MVNVNCLLECCCIICYRDDFNRPDADVIIAAPLDWDPPGLFSIVGNRLPVDTELSILLLKHDVQLGLVQEYITKVEIISMPGNGELAIFTSINSLSSLFACVYSEIDGTIAIYYVGGTSFPADWLLLNSVNVSIGVKWLRATVSLVNWVIEVAVIAADLAEETCVAPYYFNNGTKVGIGAVNGSQDLFGAIVVDNFSLCENQCLKGCVIGVDNFNRDNNVSLGPDWLEVGDTAPPDTDIVISDGAALFQATRKLFWKHPHPDGHNTMGVAIRAAFISVNDAFPGLEKIGQKPITLYACVDNIDAPTTWVEAIFNAGTGEVTINKISGGTTQLVSVTGTVFFDQPPNTLVDLYLCVNHHGRVSAYARSVPSLSPGWYLLATGYAHAIPTGTYCGMECYGSYSVTSPFQKTIVDEFAFIKTFHPGLPKIVEWTVAGTIEADDVFHIGITKGQVTIGLDVTAGSTDAEVVSQTIFDAIVAVDPTAYALLRSVAWFKGESGKIRAEDQSDFTGVADTTEAGGAVSDGQTFSVATIQAWIKGAYNCPPCPPVCGPCDLCIGDAIPPDTNSPEQVLVIVDGTQIEPLAPPNSAGGTECWAWNIPANAARDNPYGPPWPNVPPATPCDDSNNYCLSYNGAFILDGCGCIWTFHYPEWYEYYYPDPDEFGGPPGTQRFQADDADIEFTCYPGFQCNGFFYIATLEADFTVAPFDGSWIRWIVRLQEAVDVKATWKSEVFPKTECKLPRTCTFAPDFSEFCKFPSTIQLIPLH